ncbi:hypothetical protein C8J57DRAFT_1338982 [Mycena rebaudengoi]|nr:hypothetical protein C8J57DRAFT_1338982 [Mycena rebaudengoi]
MANSGDLGDLLETMPVSAPPAPMSGEASQVVGTQNGAVRPGFVSGSLTFHKNLQAIPSGAIAKALRAISQRHVGTNASSSLDASTAAICQQKRAHSEVDSEAHGVALESAFGEPLPEPSPKRQRTNETSPVEDFTDNPSALWLPLSQRPPVDSHGPTSAPALVPDPVRSGSKRYSPVPPACQIAHSPDYVVNRRAWLLREYNTLSQLGLTVERYFFTDNEMVIEWSTAKSDLLDLQVEVGQNASERRFRHYRPHTFFPGAETLPAQSPPPEAALPQEPAILQEPSPPPTPRDTLFDPLLTSSPPPFPPAVSAPSTPSTPPPDAPSRDSFNSTSTYPLAFDTFPVPPPLGSQGSPTSFDFETPKPLETGPSLILDFDTYACAVAHTQELIDSCLQFLPSSFVAR